jgi:hypothetical protein
MHNGKDAGLDVEGALDRPGIRKDRYHVRMRTQMARAGERADLACRKKLADRAAAGVALDCRGLEQRRCTRVAVAAAFVDRAFDPADGRKIDSVLVREMAADPHRRRLCVERHPDPSALEMLWSFDSRAPVDIDVAVPKHARREHRKRDPRNG